MVKPGIKTTELWLTVATDVGLVASACADALPAKWAAIGAAVANVAYGVSRGLTKLGTPSPVVPAVPAAPVQGQ